MRHRREGVYLRLTSSITTAHSAVRWRRDLATAVADLRVQKALSIAKVLAEQMLDAPEAASCHGRGLSGHIARL